MNCVSLRLLSRIQWHIELSTESTSPIAAHTRNERTGQRRELVPLAIAIPANDQSHHRHSSTGETPRSAWSCCFPQSIRKVTEALRRHAPFRSNPDVLRSPPVHGAISSLIPHTPDTCSTRRSGSCLSPKGLTKPGWGSRSARQMRSCRDSCPCRH